VLADSRRTHASGGERRRRLPAQLGSESIALLVDGDVDRAQLGEVAHQVGPGDVDAPLVEPALQIDLEPEREEAPDDVPDRGSKNLSSFYEKYCAVIEDEGADILNRSRVIGFRSCLNATSPRSSCGLEIQITAAPR
jgi:hypothetical protein